jgi:hypothetical protein
VKTLDWKVAVAADDMNKDERENFTNYLRLAIVTHTILYRVVTDHFSDFDL